jgi:hypothetical protein
MVEYYISLIGKDSSILFVLKMLPPQGLFQMTTLPS